MCETLLLFFCSRFRITSSFLPLLFLLHRPRLLLSIFLCRVVYNQCPTIVLHVSDVQLRRETMLFSLSVFPSFCTYRLCDFFLSTFYPHSSLFPRRPFTFLCAMICYRISTTRQLQCRKYHLCRVASCVGMGRPPIVAPRLRQIWDDIGVLSTISPLLSNFLGRCVGLS